MLFQKAYEDNFLNEMTQLSPEERAQKFKHLLDYVHYLVDLLHKTYAEETIPKLLNCKRVSLYRNKIYGPVEFLEVGCLVFDPKTYLLTYNIRHAIFRIAFLPPDKRWVVMYRPSYSIGYHKVGSTGYQKAIKQNILVTRSSEKIYLLTSGATMDQNKFVPIDTNFKPFNLLSLLEQCKGSPYNQTFAPLSDPDLERIIKENPVKLDNKGKIIEEYIKSNIDKENVLNMQDENNVDIIE